MNYIKTFYSIFLDDERVPQEVTWIKIPMVAWTVIRNYDQFVSHVTEYGLPARVSFDHDLSAEQYPSHAINWTSENIQYEKYKEKTGFECAKWLVEYCITNNLKFPNYTVHSMNPIGRDNIISYIESFKKSQ